LIANAKLRIIIETNGTLIDDTLARFLKATNQVTDISVSVDGANAETHEALRLTAGSYERALTGIQALVEVGFRPQLICTLHRGNASQVDEVVTLAEKLGCGSVKFNHVQQIGRGEHFTEDQSLEVKKIIQIFHYIEDKLASCSKIPILFDIPFAFYPIQKLLTSPLGRCTVHNIIGILSGGEISLCGIGTTIPELVFGNIETENLAYIWCHSPSLTLLREQIPAQLEGICGECLHRDFCLGSCIAHTYHETGRLNAGYYFCNRAKVLDLFPNTRVKCSQLYFEKGD
jgi:SynChlorMet cassette radical SAM/SPASM protein ScmF